ncbi:MAG: hypothetical protein HQK54_15600 [Oligoflexales bacterium]|nr:hypothetical protein [Oligoflexales bacterium]
MKKRRQKKLFDKVRYYLHLIDDHSPNNGHNTIGMSLPGSGLSVESIRSSIGKILRDSKVLGWPLYDTMMMHNDDLRLDLEKALRLLLGNVLRSFDLPADGSSLENPWFTIIGSTPKEVNAFLLLETSWLDGEIALAQAEKEYVQSMPREIGISSDRIDTELSALFEKSKQTLTKRIHETRNKADELEAQLYEIMKEGLREIQGAAAALEKRRTLTSRRGRKPGQRLTEISIQ